MSIKNSHKKKKKLTSCASAGFGNSRTTTAVHGRTRVPAVGERAAERTAEEAGIGRYV